MDVAVLKGIFPVSCSVYCLDIYFQDIEEEDKGLLSRPCVFQECRGY